MPRLFTILLIATLAACGSQGGPDGLAPVTNAQESRSHTAASVQPGDCVPTEAEQAMLDAVNRARSQARQCGEQTFTATQQLTFDCSLRDAAQAHTQDMRDHNFMSHTGSDGLRVASRVEAQGYAWRSVGENIAAGQSDIQAVMADWLASEDHCVNIMSPAYTQMGSAMLAGNEFNDYAFYWTQVFATPVR